jgi:hypothetical protein
MNFVKVICKNKLSDEDKRKIGDIIGTLTKVQYHKDENDYCVYITDKSLSEEEMIKIVDKIFAVGDDIYIENSLPSSVITKDKMDEIVYEVSKYIHNDMVKKKVKDGWRYGEELSYDDKTSPMIRSFDDIPESYRPLRPDIVKKVVDSLRKRK